MARLVGEKIGFSVNHENYAALLTQALGTLKGPTMKIGQILATVPDMLPPEYAQAFLSLQANAPPMGWLFVRRRMRAELGEGWETFFQSFEREATFAASLGQVHRALLKSGEVVACKLQYPEMETVVANDLKQLALFCKIYETVAGGIQTTELQAEIKARLEEELNYVQEAQHIHWFQEILHHDPEICVPHVFEDLSTRRLLTLTWLEGKPFTWLETQSLSLREHAARRLFRAWYKPFYHFGLLHGDPHLGNYTFAPDEESTLNLLDFGCVRRFTPTLVGGVIHLYHALRRGSRDDAADAYRALGFEELDTELLEVLQLWAQFLYGPLLEDRVRPLEETFSGNPGKEVAGHIHEILCRQGGVKPPRAFVFLDRAAVGIGSALIRLQVSLNWHQMFEELIADFSEEQLATRQHTLPNWPTDISQ